MYLSFSQDDKAMHKDILSTGVIDASEQCLKLLLGTKLFVTLFQANELGLDMFLILFKADINRSCEGRIA